MNKKIPIIIAAGTAITVSSAIILFKRINRTSFHNIRSYDKKFSIRFTSDWKTSKEKNELNENSNLEAINSKNGICLIMFSKPKIELNNITLDEYNETILNSIKEENIISSNKINVNNKTMHITEFNSYHDNMLIHYILYTLDTEGYFHQAMVALINSNLQIKKDKKQFNMINNILSTLKEI